MLECWRGWDGNNWTCNNLSCCSSMHFFSGLSAGRSGLSLGVHAILQLVCLRQERHLEWRMCCGPVSYMNARAGKSFWPALCHSDFGACCDSCVLVSVASNCLPRQLQTKKLKITFEGLMMRTVNPFPVGKNYVHVTLQSLKAGFCTL